MKNILKKESLASSAVPAALFAAASAMLIGCSPTAKPDAADANSSKRMRPTPPKSADAMKSKDAVMGETHVYNDGTYSAVGEYRAPSGQESINVSLTLKDGVVTEATYEGTAKMGKSKTYQDMFGEGYRTMVVGKSIDSLNLMVVNGSSLTPKGFMDAVTKIKAEAAA